MSHDWHRRHIYGAKAGECRCARCLTQKRAARKAHRAAGGTRTCVNCQSRAVGTLNGFDVCEMHGRGRRGFKHRGNPSGADKVRVLGIYPSGEVKELRVTAESLTWRKGKRKREDRLSGPFLRKFGSYPVATIAMWGSDPDFHDEAKVREMLSRYLRDSGRDERRNPARRRSRDGVSREWRWA